MFFFKNNDKGQQRGGKRKVDFILNLLNTGEFLRDKSENVKSWKKHVRRKKQFPLLFCPKDFFEADYFKYISAS